jgi:hypothetical protein
VTHDGLLYDLAYVTTGGKAGGCACGGQSACRLPESVSELVMWGCVGATGRCDWRHNGNRQRTVFCGLSEAPDFERTHDASAVAKPRCLLVTNAINETDR